jgi:Domain of unknown function (DUF5077)/Domain of unknown function (DUF3472)
MIKYLTCIASIIAIFSCSKNESLKLIKTDSTPTIVTNNVAKDQKVTIPLGGNAYITTGNGSFTEKIDDRGTIGLTNWTSSNTVVSVYFKVQDIGKVNLYLRAKVDEGSLSEIKVSIDGQSIIKKLTNTGFDTVSIGEFEIKEKGYVKVDLQGITKTGVNFGNVTDLVLQGNKVTDNLIYVKDNESSNYYWGRRGPSVHLAYQAPTDFNAEWFYNEVTIPKGGDVIGSYFMANGFAEGYFGIQVNSASERRILFSVWSPFKTDNPSAIPDDEKIILLKKGANVKTGEFGNEGSGGQSYLIYNWKPETTYKFLLKGQPTTDNYTVYTAYFYAPELNSWQIIASFKRPKTQTYLKRMHSFLENFNNTKGYLTRTANYDNAWICSETGVWKELNVAKFTGDNIARINFRNDFSGGVRDGKFFLQNGGFYNESTILNSSFTRPAKNKTPVIDFNQLP